MIIWVFRVALFIIAKTRKQPEYPSVGEWISKLWYFQMMKYYSVPKWNELSSHEKTWGGNLKVNKVNLRRLHSCIIATNMPFWKTKNYGDSKKIRNSPGLEAGEKG